MQLAAGDFLATLLAHLGLGRSQHDFALFHGEFGPLMIQLGQFFEQMFAGA